MPDDNKFEKLRECGYRIQGVCGYCVQGRFHANHNGRATWGTCAKHTYEHQKHDNPEGGRGVSIHFSGTCDTFKADRVLVMMAGLGAHLEFFDGGAEETNGS